MKSYSIVNRLGVDRTLIPEVGGFSMKSRNLPSLGVNGSYVAASLIRV